MIMNRPLYSHRFYSHQDFFLHCEKIALESPDPSRRIGSIIVDKFSTPIFSGSNDLPLNVHHSQERFSKENNEKYHWIAHAEEKIISQAAFFGISLKECTIYTTLFPCSTCARLIINSGIWVVNTYKIPENEQTYKRGFEVSQIMFEEAGVEVNLFDREEMLNG